MICDTDYTYLFFYKLFYRISMAVLYIHYLKENISLVFYIVFVCKTLFTRSLFKNIRKRGL